MDFFLLVFVGLIGMVFGALILATMIAATQPKIGTMIIDLSREDKDIAQFVFGELDLEEICRYKRCRIDIKANHLKSLEGRK